MIDVVLLGATYLDKKYKGKLPIIESFMNVQRSTSIVYIVRHKNKKTIIHGQAANIICSGSSIIDKIQGVVVCIEHNIKKLLAKKTGEKK